MKPVIGVTTSARSGWLIFPLVAFNIWLAGGVPDAGARAAPRISTAWTGS